MIQRGFYKESQYPEAAFQFFRAYIEESGEARRIFEGKVIFDGLSYDENENNEDPDYRFRLALMYLMGLGTPRNDNRAYQILQQLFSDEELLFSLQLNDILSHACNLLTSLLKEGRGVAQDKERAVLVTDEPAKAGNPLAM